MRITMPTTTAMASRAHLFFAQPEGNVTFPYGLPEGKSCSVWIANVELAKDLKRGGYSSRVRLIGCYKDAVGGFNKSRSIKFNVEKP
jgi:hypothetical protein